MSRFLDVFRKFFTDATDASYEFREAVALSILSTVVLDRRVYSNGHIPNLFILLVAGPATERKSASVQLGIEILEKVEPKRIGPSDFTSEGLLGEMQKRKGYKARNTLWLPMKEFGVFISKMGTASHMASAPATLADLYDGGTVERVRAGKGGSMVVRNPRLGLLGACALGFLQQYVKPISWTDGFFSRLCFINSETRPKIQWIKPQPDPAKQIIAVDALKNLKTDLLASASAAGVHGPERMMLSPAAEQRLEQWMIRGEREITKLGTSQIAHIAQWSRLQVIAQKAALLYQVDDDPTSMLVDVYAIDRGIAFADICWNSFKKIYDQVSGTEIDHLSDEILDFIAAEGGSVSQNQFTRRFQRRKLHAADALDLLKRVGDVQVRKMRLNPKGPLTIIYEISP